MNRVTVKIKDNSTIDSNELNEVMSIVDTISNKTISTLYREGLFIFPETSKDIEDISLDNIVISHLDGQYRTSNIVGYLRSGDEELIIGSRFSGEEDYLISYLLEKVIATPNVTSFTSSFDLNDNVLNVLMFIFPYYLDSALKKGLYKTYQRIHYNDSNLRGPININKHIKDNSPFIGNIAYSQRELTQNNYLSQLIRHTIEFLKRKPQASLVLSNSKNEIQKITEVTDNYNLHNRQNIIEENKKKLINHAYYSEYRILQQLCILILSSNGHSIGDGNNKIQGILFDISWLWEEYINTFLNDDFYHPMNKGKMGHTGVQWLFREVSAEKTELSLQGKIYPDFVSKNTINRVIADAKYKPIDNIGNRDYLQILAYMYRFNSYEGVFIYPEQHTISTSKYILNKGSSYENNVTLDFNKSITKMSISIPQDANDYEHFCQLMAVNESEFLNTLRILFANRDL